MTKLLQILALPMTFGILLLLACKTTGSMGSDGYAGVDKAVVVLQPTAGNKASGTVTLMQTSAGLKVVADLMGLGANEMHAIHVHQFGDITGADGKKTGGHYNPEMHDHALPMKKMRHAGDLGNLKSDANGKAHYEITVTNASLTGMNPVLGRAIIVHAKKDDGGQPTGNAGARIAQGVIGIANTK